MPNQTEADLRQQWADTLRLERHRLRLTQAEVAERAKVAGPTVAKVESGRGSLDTFLSVADALGVTLLGRS